MKMRPPADAAIFTMFTPSVGTEKEDSWISRPTGADADAPAGAPTYSARTSTSTGVESSSSQSGAGSKVPSRRGRASAAVITTWSRPSYVYGVALGTR